MPESKDSFSQKCGSDQVEQKRIWWEDGVYICLTTHELGVGGHWMAKEKQPVPGERVGWRIIISVFSKNTQPWSQTVCP